MITFLDCRNLNWRTFLVHLLNPKVDELKCFRCIESNTAPATCWDMFCPDSKTSSASRPWRSEGFIGRMRFLRWCPRWRSLALLLPWGRVHLDLIRQLDLCSDHPLDCEKVGFLRLLCFQEQQLHKQILRWTILHSKIPSPNPVCCWYCVNQK